MIKIALFQSDNPQNLGAFLRLSACLNLELHIIEPCGFPLDDKQLKRVAMDYQSLAAYVRHSSWQKFLSTMPDARLILLTTKTTEPYTRFAFEENDMLLLGSESSGVPDYVHAHVKHKVTIPMQSGARSLNVVNAAAMVAGEALRQTSWSQ